MEWSGRFWGGIPAPTLDTLFGTKKRGRRCKRTLPHHKSDRSISQEQIPRTLQSGRSRLATHWTTTTASPLDSETDDRNFWKTQKSHDKDVLHLVNPPCAHLSMSTRKNILHHMLFHPRIPVKSRIENPLPQEMEGFSYSGIKELSTIFSASYQSSSQLPLLNPRRSAM